MKLSSDGERFEHRDCVDSCIQGPQHSYSAAGLDAVDALEIEQYEQHVRFQVAPLLEELQRMDRALREGAVDMPRKVSKRRLELPGEGPQSFVYLGSSTGRAGFSRQRTLKAQSERTLRVQTPWDVNGSWIDRGIHFPVEKRPLLRGASEGWIKKRPYFSCTATWNRG